jgi:flavin-dependent dehydrogenase
MADMKKETSQPTINDPDDKPLAELANKLYSDLNESLEAIAIDSNQKEIFKVPISEVVDKLSTQSGIKYLVLDGIITQRLLDGAKQAGVECVVGHRVAKLVSRDGMKLKTFAELGIA